MPHFPRFATLSLLLALAPAGHAASFDCAKAESWAQRAICVEPSLGALDEALDARYREVLARSDLAASVQIEQTAWLRSTRDACTAAGCLKQVYAARLKQLDKQLAVAPPSLVSSGRYRRYVGGRPDPSGTELTLAARDTAQYRLTGKHASATAGIDGIIAPRVGSAQFQQGECSLRLMFAPDSLSVSATSPGCGTGVSYDGEYRRVD
ncbi:lysozyme inhibitor LprI family protein [Montanilutibacter psychrotolerans]|uniref:lysozyme inhibitor LprI family protein n=1 Tax=Montanilutibacter psychrotolerans TaxID=1327343 RepID=UPI0011CD56A0|nr:lysozyme inhibitor LprI family protein [Lysobacter psychrotolerans]